MSLLPATIVSQYDTLVAECNTKIQEIMPNASYNKNR